MDYFRHLPVMIAPGQQGDVQILLHAQLRKNLPALRHVTDTERCARLGGMRQQILRLFPPQLSGDAAAADRYMPHNAID